MVRRAQGPISTTVTWSFRYSKRDNGWTLAHWQATRDLIPHPSSYLATVRSCYNLLRCPVPKTCLSQAYKTTERCCPVTVVSAPRHLTGCLPTWDQKLPFSMPEQQQGLTPDSHHKVVLSGHELDICGELWNKRQVTLLPGGPWLRYLGHGKKQWFVVHKNSKWSSLQQWEVILSPLERIQDTFIP